MENREPEELLHKMKYVRNEKACVGVILAGGQSRRMGGGDKCLLDLQDKSIIQHTLDRAKNQVNILLLNCNGDETRFNFIGLPAVKDIFEGWRGPLAGIHASLNWMTANNPNATWLASFAADTPFFPEDLVERLLQQAQSSNCEIVVASYKGSLQPLFALWHISLLCELTEYLQNGGNPKMQEWIRSRKHIAVEIEHSNWDPFFNINTPADYTAATSISAPQY